MAKKPLYMKIQENQAFRPGKIGGVALVGTVKLVAIFAARWALRLLYCTFQPESDLVILDRDLSELELPEIQKHQTKIVSVHVQV